jgi:hypothetical protein
MQISLNTEGIIHRPDLYLKNKRFGDWTPCPSSGTEIGTSFIDYNQLREVYLRTERTRLRIVPRNSITELMYHRHRLTEREQFSVRLPTVA